jgi:formylmethanofuran dehydrogenase subunit D
MDEVKRVSEQRVSEHPTATGQVTISSGHLNCLGVESGDGVKVISKNDEIIIRRIDDG